MRPEAVRHIGRRGGAVTLGVIQFAGRALAGDAVALDVAEVETRRVEPLPDHLDDAGLDHDATGTESGVAVTARQHAADARATTEAVALKIRSWVSGFPRADGHWPMRWPGARAGDNGSRARWNRASGCGRAAARFRRRHAPS